MSATVGPREAQTRRELAVSVLAHARALRERAAQLRAEAKEAEAAAVLYAHDGGASWPQIARWLGVSRQHIWEKYGRQK